MAYSALGEDNGFLVARKGMVAMQYCHRVDSAQADLTAKLGECGNIGHAIESHPVLTSKSISMLLLQLSALGHSSSSAMRGVKRRRDRIKPQHDVTAGMRSLVPHSAVLIPFMPREAATPAGARAMACMTKPVSDCALACSINREPRIVRLRINEETRGL